MTEPTTISKPVSPLLPILLAILAVVAVGAAGFMYWQNQQLQEQIEILQRPVIQKWFMGETKPTVVANPTAGWKTYTDSKINFSFSHPNSWVIDTNNTDSTTLITERNNRLVVTTAIDTSPTIAEYLIKRDKESQTAWEGQPSVQVKETKKSQMNNLSYIQRQEYLSAADMTVTATYFKSGKMVIRLALEPVPGNAVSQDLLIYSQILSTIKFT